MNELIQEYYANDARKLHKTVDTIIRKIGGISDKDKDDFYSAASYAIAESWKKNDYVEDKGSKEGYLYKVINFAVLSEIRDRNRFRRSNTRPKRDENGEIIRKNGKIEYEFVPNISLDAPLNEEGQTVGNIIADPISVEGVIFCENMSNKAEKYIAELPYVARQVVLLKINGNDKDYITRYLHISSKQYTDAMEIMKSSEYISILM